MDSAHRAHHREAITGMAHIQVGNEHVKSLLRDQLQGFGHSARGGDGKTLVFQIHSQSQPDAFFVIQKEEFGVAWCHIPLSRTKAVGCFWRPTGTSASDIIPQTPMPKYS